MRVQPLANRLSVKPDAPESVSKGGIVLPTQAQDKPTHGIVTATGPDVEEIKVGDHVMYGRYAGTEFEWENEKYVIIRETDVLAVL